jgi:hypothetical protein
MPNDDGHLLLTDNERAALLATAPGAAAYVRPILGSVEFINSISRWCLWLRDIQPEVLRSMPAVLTRVEAVRRAREASKRQQTNELANTPALFGEIRQPEGRYLAVPKSSSSGRSYIPMGFLDPHVIAGSELFTSEEAGIFHFGILSSAMHMAWVRLVGGRIKSDYRYSVSLIYNNFPWPEAPGDKQRTEVETRAQGVLDARAQFPNATLADLYDPNTMPPELVKAHAALDRAVDRCYGTRTFVGDRDRVEFLFELFERLTTPLTANPTRPRRGRRPSSAEGQSEGE